MNVPKLRFKEFNDEWDYKIFDELINIKSESYNPSLNKENYKCIELEHINQNTGTINGYCNSQDQKSNKNIFKKNEVLFGKLRPYLKKYWYATFDGVCSSEIWVGKSKNQNIVTNKFIYDLFQSHYFLQLCNLSTGSKMPRADWSFIKEQSIAIPNILEQKKISETLELLDKKIELQSKKIEDLKLFKKGLLKKNYYKIANNNLTELSCIANIYQPQTISQSELDNGKYYVFGANGIIGKYSKFNHKFMQVTISCRGENSGTINLTPDECWITGNSMVLNVDENKNVDKLYLKNILEAQNLKYLISGSGQPQIVRSSVLKHKIPYISIEQQKKFTIPFIKLDSKIKLEQNKLDKLQELKKGLMQSMFV